MSTRYNHELYSLFKEPDIVKFIKIRRLEWAGHVLRASDQRIMKKVFKTMPEGTRKVGRPKMRWEDCVRQDIRTLGIRNWRSVALSRQAWRELLRKAKAHTGLSCHWWWWCCWDLLVRVVQPSVLWKVATLMHVYIYTFNKWTKYGSWLLCAHRATEWHSVAVKAKFWGFNNFYSLSNKGTNFIII